MEKKKQPKPENILARTQFYEWARNELHYSKEITVRLLQGMGFESFNPEDVEEYKRLLTEHYLSERRADLIRKAKETSPLPISCPLAEVPGIMCPGSIVREKFGIAQCTVGGFAHLVAGNLMKTEGFDPVKFMADLEKLRLAKAEEQEAALAKWREGIST